MNLPDFVPAPNIGRHPEVYALENEALARDGALDAALLRIAPLQGKTLLDIGSGTGFWLPRYAQHAARVIGVEPDPTLRALYTRDEPVLLAGSAERLPLDDHSVDVAHARFAYFFGPGSERGLAEVDRVLRPGGCLLAIDNSWRGGQFAELLEDATTGNAAHDPDAIDAWWAARGAVRHEVEGAWRANSPAELEQILRIEFPGATIDRFLAREPGLSTLTYRFAVFAYRSEG